MSTIKFVIAVTIVLVSADLLTHLTINAYGQEVNRTEEASRKAKEILCKEYNFEYCEGQEITKGQEVTKCSTLICDDHGTDSANTTTLKKLQHDCFTAGNYFDPYYGYTRCLLK